jgi:hypothetical protein
MKVLLATFGLAVLLSPALALADDNAAPPSAAQMQTRSAEFQQMHQKMAQLHTQARTEMLAAITPAHKAAIANLIGQLAIAPNPNVDATAREIDSLLTPAESQSVIRIHEQAKTQMHALMESAHAQMERERPAGAPEHAPRPAMPNRPNDAGHIILMLAIPAPHGMMMMHHGM